MAGICHTAALTGELTDNTIWRSRAAPHSIGSDSEREGKTVTSEWGDRHPVRHASGGEGGIECVPRGIYSVERMPVWQISAVIEATVVLQSEPLNSHALVQLCVDLTDMVYEPARKCVLDLQHKRGSGAGFIETAPEIFEDLEEFGMSLFVRSGRRTS